MAAESILTYKKPGFPKTSNTEKSYRTIIEYVGPEATLSSAEPAANATWGDYDGIVVSTDLDPIEGTTQANLTVITEYFYDGAGGGGGTLREVVYEVEWVMFQRSMFEHPVFAVGGGGAYALDDADIVEIQAWQNTTDSTVKGVFQYSDDAGAGSLSANAVVFAKGLNLGQETYEDYAPVIRKTTSYAGGLPPASSAGLKGGEPSFTGKPSGYEWRKSADRAVRSKGQTRWDRVEEWTGAKKVLSDRNAIYW